MRSKRHLSPQYKIVLECYEMVINNFLRDEFVEQGILDFVATDVN